MTRLPVRRRRLRGHARYVGERSPATTIRFAGGDGDDQIAGDQGVVRTYGSGADIRGGADSASMGHRNDILAGDQSAAAAFYFDVEIDGG